LKSKFINDVFFKVFVNVLGLGLILSWQEILSAVTKEKYLLFPNSSMQLAWMCWNDVLFTFIFIA